MPPRRAAHALFLALAASPCLHAAERYAVELHDVPGMPGAISDLAQDEDGFLWVSSEEGLFRFDGTEFVRRGRRIGFHHVAAGAGGRVVAGKENGVWHEWEGERLVELAGADGAPLQDLQGAGYDRSGALWAVSLDRAFVRDAGGRWTSLALLPGRTGRCLAVHPEGGIVVGTREGAILRVDASRGMELLAEGLGGLVNQLAIDGEERVVANVRWGPNRGVIRLDRGRVEHLATLEDRPTGLAVRGGVVWSSWDTGVVALRPGFAPERLHPRDGFQGGGHVRVDREGSLWVTSFAGDLVRFPEPDTRVYSEKSGLPSALVRELVVAGTTRWAATWGGALRFAASEDRFQPVPADRYLLRELLCPLGSGAALTVGVDRAAPGSPERGTLLLLQADEVRPIGTARSLPLPFHCAERGEGGLWASVGDRLTAWSAEGAMEGQFSLAGIPPVEDLAVAPGGALWALSEENTLCRTADPGAGWTCQVPTGLGLAVRLAPMTDGRVWVATLDAGLLVCEGGACRPLLSVETLGTVEVVDLERSPLGGTWVLSRTLALRVEEEPGGPRILERLSRWQGVPPWWLAALREEDDGTVWLVGLAGIVRVPASARAGRTPPPAVRATHAAVGGREQLPGVTAVATSGRDVIEVKWAALSYREPTSLRYAFRLDPSAPWVTTEFPRVVIVAPRAGRYRMETAAALGSGPWGAAPTTFALHVVPPWYQRAPFLVGVLVALGGVGVAAYRLRVAHLLRLERQRTQIAMDLHDDLGATLAGIGLLASLAEDDAIAPGERHGILRRIARQTGSAGHVLSDIVWSLRPGAETLDQLVLALRERAFELCPEDRVTLDLDFPEPVPPMPLTLLVRRNVLWIAVEALRNAVRHADPRRVAIRLQPAGSAWRIEVEDDGRGVPAGGPAQVRGGLGQESMRRRAEAMRARLKVTTAEDGGTRVVLLFQPDGRWPRTII